MKPETAVAHSETRAGDSSRNTVETISLKGR